MQLSEYLPLYFQNIEEYTSMMQAEQPEINALSSALNSALNNEFIETLDEAGCSRWESMLGITPMSTATIQDRRFVISSKYKESLPYTMQALTARLNSTLGADNYYIHEATSDWTLTLKVMLTRKQQLNEIKSLMENLVPCNIILDIGLMYNQYQTLAPFTHEHLASYSYGDLREEVIA